MSAPRILRASLAGLALSLSGCSSFERAWNEREEGAAPDAAADGSTFDELAGRWQGTWLSAANGHTGALRALIARLPAGSYEAWYHATYGCCFSFQYKVAMSAEDAGEAIRFKGNADLGWLAGGVYEYAGEVGADRFRSTYNSAADHGTFDMVRVQGGR